MTPASPSAIDFLVALALLVLAFLYIVLCGAARAALRFSIARDISKDETSSSRVYVLSVFTIFC